MVIVIRSTSYNQRVVKTTEEIEIEKKSNRNGNENY